ncbi:hypothetical protein E3T40_07160 [Cryobacterium sp. TMT1-19]|nr:hypothetical protein E3T40_07160 [Cryobacterium sp. TMT1-19]
MLLNQLGRDAAELKLIFIKVEASTSKPLAVALAKESTSHFDESSQALTVPKRSGPRPPAYFVHSKCVSTRQGPTPSLSTLNRSAA